MTLALRIALLRTEVQILVWRYGLLWVLAVALAAGAAFVHFSMGAPARAALMSAEGELAEALANPAPRAIETPHLGEEQQLEALTTVLRHPGDPAQLIRKLSKLAEAQQITLVQSEYQHQFHSATEVTQLLVTQPVHAGYPQLKRYIESVLRTLPNVSLDQISARRETVGQAQLEVRLRWSIWMHSPKAVRSGAAEARAGA